MIDELQDFPEFIHGFAQADVPMGNTRIRFLADENQGQASFVTMGEGAEVGLHDHDDSWAIVVSGALEVICGEKKFTARKGDTWFIPKGTLHGGRALEPTLMIEVFCEQRFSSG